MRIVHFSDLHIGVENYGRIDPKTGLSTRMGDFLTAFDELVDYSISTQVDLVIFAGDAFKSREPNQTQQREFAKRIIKLANENIQVFLLVGNHDLPHALARATSVEIYETLSVSNVIVADKPGTHLIATPAGPIQVVALPWPRRSLLLAREHAKNLPFKQLNETLQRILTERLISEAHNLDSSVPAVATAHVTVAQATVGSERSMMIGNDHVLLLSNVALPSFDYVALGHIHKTQVLSTNPPVVYSGSLQRIDFSEEHDPKGFYIIEIDPVLPQGKRVINYNFHPVEARPFVTIDVNIASGDTNPTNTIIQEIKSRPIANAVVRIRINVPSHLEPMVIDSEIRKSLTGTHFIAAISKEVDRERKARLGSEAIEAMTPIDVLKAYLNTTSDDRGWSDDQIATMISKSEELIHQLNENPQ